MAGPTSAASNNPSVDSNIPRVDTRVWHDDWPEKSGQIDLSVHDLPHGSSDVEWWYVNSHLKSTSGKEMSLFACFFRTVIGYHAKSDQLKYAHSVAWGVTDAQESKHLYYCMLEPCVKEHIVKTIDDEDALDKYLCRSLKEAVVKNVLPLPDMETEGEIKISEDKLLLIYGDNTFEKDADGCYHLTLKGRRPSEDTVSGCSLKIKPLKPPTRNRSDGVVKVGLYGDDMFYYFISRNECTGSVVISGEEFYVTGTAWYDHEFGGTIRAIKPSPERTTLSGNLSWEWLSVQFEDGTDLTACNITAPNADKTHHLVDSYSITLGSDGTRKEESNPQFHAVPGKVWRSTKTFVEYPTAWVFKQGDIVLDITVGGIPGQELITLMSFPAFWEGRVECTGTVGGKFVRGLGFVELHGQGRKVVKSLKNLFEASAQEMRKSIREVMPLESSKGTEPATDDDTFVRVLGEDGSRVVDRFPRDLGRQAVVKNIFEPLRDTYDRGGKAWRSLALFVCIDAVGGNSNDYKYLLPVPEFLHAGSLILDDIQDKSVTRRGKECCHIIWGEALAINAGCFSYFVGPGLYRDLPDEKRLKLFDLFFSTMLSGHVGQGADIVGLNKIMPEVVESGKVDLATEVILGIHRLKSGIPVRHMAQSGCILGDGSPEQVEGLGAFFEEVGVAFQVIDDVVNLNGFNDQNWKTCGEDVMEGKVTFPVALAMKYVDKKTRQNMWASLESKPQDIESVTSIIRIVRETGALEESREYAVDMVETAWKKAGPLVPDSFSKLVLRGMSLFILDHLKDSKSLPDSYF